MTTDHPAPLSLPRDLAELTSVTALQHGCFTRAQAKAAGVGASVLRSRRERGELLEPYLNVFEWTGSPPSFARDCWAALLSLPGAAVTDRAAARLHGFDGFASAPVEVLVPWGGPNRRNGLELLRTKRWLGEEVTTVRGLAVTSVPWTLARLGRILDDRRLQHAVDDALRKGTTEGEVRRVLDLLHRPGQRATSRLRRVLDQPWRAGPPPDSWFEHLVERALTAPGLPTPSRQHRVVVRGRLIARLDLAYPVVRVGVEAQSRAPHASPSQRRADRARISRLADAQWEIVEWWWEDLADSAEAIALVRAACRRQAERLGVDPHRWVAVTGRAS